MTRPMPLSERPPAPLTRLAITAASAVAMALTPFVSAASAIEGGRFPADTAATRATVSVENCTGTLVAPDLVLSAGHCWPALEAVPSPEFHAPFNRDREGWGANDWQRPDRMYPVDLPVTVGVGRRGAFMWSTRTVEYAKPGNADMILFRLARAVPATAATPVPVLTRLPDPVRADAWVQNRRFTAAGFGRNSSGTRDGRLREATLRGAIFPCPRNNLGWGGGNDHKLCTLGVDGSGRPGDSGGPLYWTDSRGRRHLAGVLQGIESRRRGSRYSATFYRGGADYIGLGSAPLPNTGSWIERWVSGRLGATAYLRSPGFGGGYANRAFAMNPGGLDPKVTRVAAGVYEVRFPGLRSISVSFPLVRSVTAEGGGSAYCKLGAERVDIDDDAARPGARDDTVIVRCFNRQGRPVDNRFALLSENVGASSTAIVTREGGQSADVTPSVTTERVARGLYEVRRRTRGTPWKYASATAHGDDAIRCNVVSWLSGTARVRCVDAEGQPADSGFHFQATASPDQSYAWSSAGGATPGRVGRLHSNVAGSTSRPTVTRRARGRYRVTFPGLPPAGGGNAQASVYGVTGAHCKVTGQRPDSIDVACFDHRGSWTDSRFTVRYVDPLDTGVPLEFGLSWIRGLVPDVCIRGGEQETEFQGLLALGGGASGSATIPTRDDSSLRRFSGSRSIKIRARSRPGERFVDALLSLSEMGDPGCRHRARLVDIAPGRGYSVLRLRIDLLRHRIEVLDPDPSIQSGFGLLSVSGRDAANSAQVGVYVDVPPYSGAWR